MSPRPMNIAAPAITPQAPRTRITETSPTYGRVKKDLLRISKFINTDPPTTTKVVATTEGEEAKEIILFNIIIPPPRLVLS